MMTPLPFERPIYVSRPVLPPLEDYVALLESIWSSFTLTNMGPMHQMLERAIGDRIGFGETTLWNNGTSALIGAIQALELSGKVIVTPFTFPATVHAVSLLGLEPVFADIDDESMTIDPVRVAEAVDSETTAVVGTHVYGNFCDTKAIAAIAGEHGLRVVYDGAHSFARERPGFDSDPTLLGDITMLSFHATKLFHSVEGGATITRDLELDRRLRLLRNFGIKSESEIELVGFNGKMSEFHAAMGIAMIGMLSTEIAQRAEVAAAYQEGLAGIDGVRVVAGTGESVQYLVIRVNAGRFGSTRDDLFATLRSMNVLSRRYFSPLVSEVRAYSARPSARSLPVAHKVAGEVLVLPLYGSMSPADAIRIADIIRWQGEGGGR